jgi:hypothetical protein
MGRQHAIAGFFAAVLMIMAVLVYGSGKAKNNDYADRNVPGATTGIGKNSLARN